MSEAFVCDRCGVTISGQPPMQVGTKSASGPAGNVGSKPVESDGGRRSLTQPPQSGILGTGRRTKTYITGGDLCDDCAEEFREFWESGDGDTVEAEQ